MQLRKERYEKIDDSNGLSENEIDDSLERSSRMLMKKRKKLQEEQYLTVTPELMEYPLDHPHRINPILRVQ